jgi:acyl-CoA thioesterase FadM
MWVETLGTTSISFGHAITFQSELLATMTRVYARINTQTGALLKVSDKERTEMFPATPRRDVLLPTVTKLAIPSENDMKQLFHVRIGPQHCNNNHVDHAALADLLLQGMYIQGYPFEKQKLVVRYLAPAALDQTLSVCLHRSQPIAALYEEGVDTPLVIGQIETTVSSNL